MPFRWILALVALSASADGEIRTIVGETMGTTYSIKWVDSSGDSPALPDPADLKKQVDQRLNAIVAMMSTYDATSELSKFNASTSTDWFPVSLETAEVVQAALTISQLSSGAFDPTVGRLVRLWRFGKDPASHGIPATEEISMALTCVGYQHVQVRLDPPALKKDLPELELDLSAIAKGFGVDAISELLQSQGIQNSLVEIGGEVSASGEKENAPWRLGIERPESLGTALQATVALRDQSLATSGDYRNRYSYQGKLYSHTIDPSTGSPVTHSLASTSVVTESCMLADAWATALTVLGPEEGLKLANEHQLAAYFILREGEGFKVLTSTRGERLFLPVDEDVASSGRSSNTFPMLFMAAGVMIIALSAWGTLRRQSR